MKVVLTAHELMNALAAANKSCTLDHDKHKFSGSSTFMKKQNAETGCMGELAVAKLLGCRFNGERIDGGDGGIDMYYRVAGGFGLNIDVKSTRSERGYGLISDYELNGACDTFVFATVLNLTNVEVDGWCYSDEVKSIAECETMADGRKRYKIDYKNLRSTEALLAMKRETVNRQAISEPSNQVASQMTLFAERK